VTDAGLVHLRGMTQMVHLWLYMVKVTDAGLQNLQTMKDLERLDLWDTQVTEAGRKSLGRTLHKLTIRATNPNQRSYPAPPKASR